MQNLYPDDLERQREIAIDRYILAFDRGDLDTMASILDEAIDDPELDRRLVGVHSALHAEAGLQPVNEQAQLVRRLAYQYIPSGIPTDDELPQVVTVGDVAAHLKGELSSGRLLSSSDVATNERLLQSGIPIPTPVTSAVMSNLAAQLQISASERYLEAFRRAAVMLAMARQRDYTVRTAARRQTTARHLRKHGPRRPLEREEES